MLTLRKILPPITALGLSAIAAHAQSYTDYNTLLAKYNTPNGVQYAQWVENSADHKKLDQTLTDWSKVDATKLPPKDRAAFRINLYNAAMIAVVLDTYPVESVTQIGPSFSIFKLKFIRIPNKKISLDTLEKELLMVDYPDARLHFAVNCGSMSCPPLRSEAYTGERLEEQLREQTEKFMVSDRAIQVKDKVAHYSSLFDWYKADFKEENPANIINTYSSKKIPTDLEVKWIEYNWDLNDAKHSDSSK